MTSLSSKAIPYVVLGSTMLLVFMSNYVPGFDAKLDQLLPILGAMGLGGIPKSIVEQAMLHYKEITIAKAAPVAVVQTAPTATVEVNKA